MTFQYIAIHTASGAQSEPATVTLNYQGEMLVLDGREGSGSASPLQSTALAVMYQAAIERWRGAGVDRETLASRLADTRLVIADLPGVVLGAATASGTIFVDVNAAGHGWFVDPTSGDDREFARATVGSERVALPGSPAYGHVDLLTVLEHEIGHLLGLEHSDEAGDIMQDALGLGTRRAPSALNAAAVDFLFSQWQADRERR